MKKENPEIHAKQSHLESGKYQVLRNRQTTGTDGQTEDLQVYQLFR